MPDREKVIVGIEHCDKLGCSMCPYKPGGYSPMDCRIQLMRDALALLKEQEEREKKICKKICNFIRGSCSTDTYEDKVFVCHKIQECFKKGR